MLSWGDDCCSIFESSISVASRESMQSAAGTVYGLTRKIGSGYGQDEDTVAVGQGCFDGRSLQHVPNLLRVYLVHQLTAHTHTHTCS